MIIRKFYTWKDEVVFDHLEYPKGANKKEIEDGKTRPIITFRSYPKTAEGLVEISEKEYFEKINQQAKGRMESLSKDCADRLVKLESAKQKLLSIGLTEDEFNALVGL